MSTLNIRYMGDPVLRSRAEEIVEIDDLLVRLTDSMHAVMQMAGGIGLAAPQIGISRRFFVYDLGDGPQTLLNPEIKESDGEWIYDEGCLSVPGYSWEIIRPKQILVSGKNLDGGDIEFEADELFSRLIQHEVDHLDGVLLMERLEKGARRQALKSIRKNGLTSSISHQNAL